MPGFYDDTTGQYIPDKDVGKEYELEEFDRKSIEDIRKRLRQGKFRSRDDMMASIEFLENLNKKLFQAIKEEDAAGNDNWTLKMARDDVVKLFTELRQEYSNMED